MKMRMRPSRVLGKLRSGKTVSCVKVSLLTAESAEIAACCGVDCVWLDMEHVPADLHEIGEQVRAAKLHDVDTVVRVPRGSYSDLIRPLELDATGIMVPHVMSIEDAQKIAWQTRFHPVGRRPIDGGNADACHSMIPLKDYLHEANRERFVIAQIEDPEPMAELDAIAQVPGIDMLFFGPADFSQGIGHPGDMSNPQIIDARRQIAETARRYGKFAGTLASLDMLDETVALGYQFINVGADVLALVDYYRRIVAAFERPWG
jgi:4-hydroxy-2-oxoheptanedioate aldolase